MKSAIIVFSIILFAACNSSKKIIIHEEIIQKSDLCIEAGVCEIQVLPKSNLEFKKDEFDNLYPIITEGTNTVFIYSFTKKTDPSIQDSNYKELIYAQTEGDIKNTSLENKDLEKVQLHFGRLCYCKGETGYFSVSKGFFKIEKLTKTSFHISISFKVDNIPQLVSEIKETIILKSN